MATTAFMATVIICDWRHLFSRPAYVGSYILLASLLKIRTRPVLLCMRTQFQSKRPLTLVVVGSNTLRLDVLGIGASRENLLCRHGFFTRRALGSQNLLEDA